MYDNNEGNVFLELLILDIYTGWYSSGANHHDAAEQHNCFLAIWLRAWVTSPSS